jgi:hypothetical protein
MVCNPIVQVCEDMDRSTKLPAEGPHDAARLVVATLDVNVGSSLPAEELVGQQPQASAISAPAPAWHAPDSFSLVIVVLLFLNAQHGVYGGRSST